MSGDLLGALDTLAPEPPTAFSVTPEISRALGGLALAVNHRLIPEQERVVAFSVRDLDVGLVRRACARLAQTEDFWPNVKKFRDTVEAIAREDAREDAQRKVLPALPDDPDEPRYFCLECRDESSGWQIVWCPGTGPERNIVPSDRALSTRILGCGKQKPHSGHTYAERCACFETNPVIARRRELERVRARKPGS